MAMVQSLFWRKSGKFLMFFAILGLMGAELPGESSYISFEQPENYGGYASGEAVSVRVVWSTAIDPATIEMSCDGQTLTDLLVFTESSATGVLADLPLGQHRLRVTARTLSSSGCAPFTQEFLDEITISIGTGLSKNAIWPQFRYDTRNSGYKPLEKMTQRVNLSLLPWQFETGRGIFSTAIQDDEGIMYVGSADTYFYALSEQGEKLWAFKTGQIIDSAGAISQDGTLYFPSGDGFIYSLDRTGQELWKFETAFEQGYVAWWEGNITIGPDGTLYAGNDDFKMYAISPDGQEKWSFETRNNVWSAPAIGAAGHIYFGSLDLHLYCLDHDGGLVWKKLLDGPIVASPALSPDKTVLYLGTFGSSFYAIDTQNGDVLWQVKAREHVYSSAAVGLDGRIYVGSADGSLYAYSPQGERLWSYDTGDPIRSSPIVGPDGTIYFGCGNGKLYAINPDGSRKWSYDTTIEDRNDLNASPSLARDYVIISGEKGYVYGIPYGYCESHSEDTRCDLSPAEEYPANGTFVMYTSPGGSTSDLPIGDVDPANVFTQRLMIRSTNETLAAKVLPVDLVVKSTPEFAKKIEISTNGEFINIIPQEFLTADTNYRIESSGQYIATDSAGNEMAPRAFAQTMNIHTRKAELQQLPLLVEDAAVSVLELKRLLVSQPTIAPSFNQIGFDSYNFLAGTVSLDRANKNFILWVAGGIKEDSLIRLDSQTRVQFPLRGEYVNNFLTLHFEDFELEVDNVNFPLTQLRFSGRVDEKLNAPDGVGAYAETRCLAIEYFGPILYLAGMCNQQGNMIAVGKAELAGHQGPEGKKVSNLKVASIRYMAPTTLTGAATVEVVYESNTLKVNEHLAGIMLTDAATGIPLSLNYGVLTKSEADSQGNFLRTVLTIPEPRQLLRDKKVMATLIWDLYPLFGQTLTFD
jgi:outer membrane protein assembly factor BamB